MGFELGLSSSRTPRVVSHGTVRMGSLPATQAGCCPKKSPLPGNKPERQVWKDHKCSMKGSPAFKARSTGRHRKHGVSVLWECQSESRPCPLWAVGICLKDNSNTQHHLSTYYVPSSRFDAPLELFLLMFTGTPWGGWMYRPPPPVLASSISQAEIQCSKLLEVRAQKFKLKATILTPSEYEVGEIPT